MIFTDSWKFFYLNFLVKGNTVFFETKKLMKRWYLLITEKFLFWATEKFLFWNFRWWEIHSFFSQKVDVKIIFTWFFWAFHDIPGPGKYSFSCSGHTGFRINIWRLSQECINWTFLKILKLLSKILISHTRFQINI